MNTNNRVRTDLITETRRDLVRKIIVWPQHEQFSYSMSHDGTRTCVYLYQIIMLPTSGANDPHYGLFDTTGRCHMVMGPRSMFGFTYHRAAIRD